MLRRTFLAFSLTLAAMGVSLSSTAQASEHGTAAEAEALAKRAVAHIKADGPEKAYADFTNGTAFKDRDLYVGVFDMNGVNLAHGANPKMVGKNLINIKDPSGLETIKMQIAIVKEKGKGWSQPFQFINPVTGKMQEKVMYVERLGDTWLNVGYYK